MRKNSITLLTPGKDRYIIIVRKNSHFKKSDRRVLMDKRIQEEYVKILKEELVPAMGCTEPIAVAYASAYARELLGEEPMEVIINVSANILKNVKSVVVPNTGGLKGIAVAAAAGIVAGNAKDELQIISQVSKEDIPRIRDFATNIGCTIMPSQKPYIFHIVVTLKGAEHCSSVEIAGYHTNVIKTVLDEKTLFEKEYEEWTEEHDTDRSLLTVERIVEFADTVDLAQVKDVLDRQIQFNTAIAEEGLKEDYGANIGNILLSSYGDSVHNRAKAYAAAASDARMNGCDLPVVVNSGSGNQGLTASLPVLIYAQELGASQELRYRALLVSNLVTIHLKTGIGRLSAYCGATSAGCGAGAGIAYLHGGKAYEVAHTIVNSLAINSGMICDGAKSSCAAKIASAVEAGLLGFQMMQNHSQFRGGDGIIIKGVENTIKNIGELARDGMAETDKVIYRIMMR